MGIIGDIVHGAITGVAAAVKGNAAAPRHVPQFAPAANIPFVSLTGAVQPDVIIPTYVDVPATLEAATLLIGFHASDEDDGYFTLDQPAEVVVFSLLDESEFTVGMRLDQELELDTAPGLYAAMAVVYEDDDFEDVDGFGFTVISVDEWGYTYPMAIELYEADEDDVEEALEDIEDELSELFS